MNDLDELNNDIAKNTEDGKNIIELTDIVENGSDIKFDKDNKIIELTNLVNDDDSFDDSTDPDLFSPDSDINEPDFDEELDFSEDYDFTEVSDIGKSDLINTYPDVTKVENDGADHANHQHLQVDTDISVTDVSLTDRQFESALEKVIEKKFAEKIETLLFQIVEKVVENEIADIKGKLTKKITEIKKI